MPAPDKAQTLANARQAAHGMDYNGNGCLETPVACHVRGARGELEFARVFGMEVDTSVRPGGDGGHDFSVMVGGRVLTIDVKTARVPFYLFLNVDKAKQAADILVLAHELPDKSVQLLGWEHGSVMRLMPVKDFGYGLRNHYRPVTQLRPIEQLRALLDLRKES